MNKKNWAQIFLESLIKNGVDRIYGYPGWAIIPLYDKLTSCTGLEHILVRHEQAASFAAAAQSRSTWKIWVCLVTSWPWAANALTWVYDAFMDSVPLIFITAQVPHSLIWLDVFQEMDTIWATMSYTKHSFLIDDVNKIPKIVNESFKIATTWRPWPVHIDLPKDIQNTLFTSNINISWYNYIKQNYNINQFEIIKIINLLKESKKPILLIWQWIKISQATDELNSFINILWIPTVSTLHAKWIINTNNINYLWMVWMHWFYHANKAIYDSDLIINIWSRFDDRIVWNYETFWKNAKIVHVDIDPSEINKVVKVDVWIISDAKDFLLIILKKDLKYLNIDNWRNQIDILNKKHPFVYKTKHFSVKNALWVINTITKNKLNDYIFLTDVWQHQMWSAQVLKVPNSRSWLTSWWAWIMWFALPSAIGVSFSNKDKTVIVIVWDWWIQMNIQELQVIKEYNLNIKIIIMNNNYLWMVRQLQDLFYEKNYSSTHISSPNFKIIWDAYWIISFIAEDENNFKNIIEEQFITKWPVIIEIKIPENEDNIFPMVPPWKSLDETLVS